MLHSIMTKLNNTFAFPAKNSLLRNTLPKAAIANGFFIRNVKIFNDLNRTECSLINFNITSRAKRNASRNASARTERDADGVTIAVDADDDGPLVIPTRETKERIKSSLSSSITFKKEQACMVCDVMKYGFDELLIESFPMIYSNIRTYNPPTGYSLA